MRRPEASCIRALPRGVGSRRADRPPPAPLLKPRKPGKTGANDGTTPMSNPGDADATPITSISQLAAHVAEGCKPAAAWRIGTEHEKFGFDRATLAPPPYAAASGGTIQGVLGRLAACDASPIMDGPNVIGLKQRLLDGASASVSLEPAGQLELSGGPLSTLHETAEEMRLHLAQARAAGEAEGLGFAPLGFHPTMRRDQMPWMPKGRYALMRGYMPRVGALGLDMMTRTCTVQVNLDYASEADMRRKLRVALILQPLATALFANSPFTEGRPNGFVSYRAHVWTDVDAARSGMPAHMLAPDMSFERHARWLVDELPMYFVMRNGAYIDVSGRSFRDFLDGRVPELAGVQPTLGDFDDHMTTAFTDVRLKRFLEMRGSDAGSPAMMVAQSALWVGLLYDDAALSAAEALVRRLTRADALAWRAEVPRAGLSAKLPPALGPGTLRDLAREVVATASDGLRARNRLDDEGRDERVHLAPLQEIAAGGPVQAERWLARYEGSWSRDVRPIFAEAAI